VRQTCWTAAGRVSCEQQAAAWSVTASVVNNLRWRRWHVGIYASPDNWRTCFNCYIFVQTGPRDLVWQGGRSNCPFAPYKFSHGAERYLHRIPKPASLGSYAYACI